MVRACKNGCRVAQPLRGSQDLTARGQQEEGLEDLGAQEEDDRSGPAQSSAGDPV